MTTTDFSYFFMGCHDIQLGDFSATLVRLLERLDIEERPVQVRPL